MKVPKAGSKDPAVVTAKDGPGLGAEVSPVALVEWSRSPGYHVEGMKIHEDLEKSNEESTCKYNKREWFLGRISILV